MATKEPEYMRELHKIREKLSKKWEKMTEEEKIRSTKEAADKAKARMKELREKRKRAIPA